MLTSRFMALTSERKQELVNSSCLAIYYCRGTLPTALKEPFLADLAVDEAVGCANGSKHSCSSSDLSMSAVVMLGII